MKLELRQVSKRFTERDQSILAVDNLSFAVASSAFVTLLGPSGSGKSTSFNLITGLITPDQGEILLDGRNINGRTGLVSYMPQHDLLLPWRTVLNNAVIGYEIAGRPRSEGIQRAKALLPTFGLAGFEHTYPATLSGGMRQRAALLRTFLLEKDMLLLDEPFGALDALTRADLQEWLLNIWNQFHPTILFITHDVREAVLMSDHVFIFTARPGRIKRQVAIDLPRPRDDTSPAFIKLQSYLLQLLKQDG